MSLTSLPSAAKLSLTGAEDSRTSLQKRTFIFTCGFLGSFFLASKIEDHECNNTDPRLRGPKRVLERKEKK